MGDISWAAGVNLGGTPSIYDDLATAGLTLATNDAAGVAAALSTKADDSDIMKKVADVFYARKGAVVGSANTKTGDNYVISNLTVGYYLVTDEYNDADSVGAGAATLSRNILAVVGDVTAAVKSDKPTVEKKILNPAPVDANAAGVGDTVAYRITTAVPNYAGYDKYFFVINDTLSAGLTFDGVQNLVVKVGESPLNPDTEYVVYTGDQADGHTFQVAFKDIKHYPVGNPITVTYTATVNANAVIGNAGNPNTTDLIYSNNPNNSSGGNPSDNPKPGDDIPTGKTPEDKTITYVAEIDLTKYFDTIAAGNELAGAGFTLTGSPSVIVGTGADVFVADDNGTYYKLTDGTYTTTVPHGDILRSDGTVAVNSNEDSYDSTTQKYKLQHVTTYTTSTKDVMMQGTSGDDGKIVFKGLGAGTYTLTETVTPAGYTTALPITVVIDITVPDTISTGTETATFSLGTGTTDGVTLRMEDGATIATAGIYDTSVVDHSGSTLPSTGGIGTTIFYVVGTILVLGAGVVLVTRKRVNSGK